MQVAPLIIAGLVASTVPVLAQDAFVLACGLPYADIARKHSIDQSCPPDGHPASANPNANANLAVEYRFKNNLCASEPAIDVTLADLIAMQQDIENDPRIPIGQRETPLPDREILKKIHKLQNGTQIGEGDRVRLVAYVTGAKATGTSRRNDGTAGEGVNCGNLGASLNDIHIDVGSSPTTQACDGIVVEMIPHYRPTAWTPTKLNKLASRPVRITGHLFLDSRHHVSTCSNPSTGDPPRISLWEIHPVYAVDVCKSTTLSNCTMSDDSNWVPFNEWLNLPATTRAKLLPKKSARQHLKTE
jgi:hypothetical protein